MKRNEMDVGCCGVCGQVRPRFAVEDVNHALLGCERCLTIREDGVVRL